MSSGDIDIFGILIAMKVHVLAFDGVFDTGLAIVLDTFATANELAAMVGLTALRFDVCIVGVRETVRTSQGLSMLIVPAATILHRS